MRISRARALLLATAALVSCGKGSSSSGGGDAGLHGPTDVVVTWTLAGAPANAASCMAHGAAQIDVVLSGTIDPSLHQDTTVDCSMGSVTFSQLLIENLGMPLAEGTLLDAKGMTVLNANAETNVVPALPTTNVTLAFFAPSGTGGATASSSSSQAASSSSSGGTGGTGGMATGSSSSGGTGGAPASSSSSSSASSSGVADAGNG